MADINDLYPSKYLKAHDLGGKTVKATIRHVLVEKIGSDTKPVLYFKGKEKGMVLNKTNAFTVSQAFGMDTDDWGGGEIEIFAAFVDFQGKQVEGLRIRLPSRQRNADWQAPPARQRREPVSEFVEDDENPAPCQRKPAPAMATADEDLDDDVPF